MSDRGGIPASVIKQYEPATHRRGASPGPLASSWFLSGLSLQWHRGRAGGMAEGLVTLFMCGDVMLGRGVDQILPHPGDPELREDHAEDARAYVRLAERAHGPIPRPVRFSWPWGDALAVIDEVAGDARVINLETSVTHSARFAPGKPVHYG